MSTSSETRERAANGKFYRAPLTPDRYAGMYVPVLPHWTPIGILYDANKHRRGSLAGAGFEDVPGAPISLRDANRMHEYGLLAKANRRIGNTIEVVFMTPSKMLYS